MRLPVSPIILIATLAIAPDASAATLRVPADYSTIQSCIDAAVSGQDECIVAPGTYNELINFLGKAITLRSSDGPEVTIIDGTGHLSSVVTCTKGEGPNTVLNGFTIKDGKALDDSTTGGGMHNDHSSPTVTNCTFTGNTAAVFGGGMYNSFSNPTVSNCTFTGNTADYGGGMYNENGNPTVTDCTFNGNTAFAFGGGMYTIGSDLTVSNCRFAGNSAFWGGGIYHQDGNPTFNDCTFNGNTGSEGGGIYNGGGGTSSTMVRCTFSANTADYGGGILNIGNSPTMSNCTFGGNIATNSGGGIYNDNSGNSTVTNCILWGDAPTEIINLNKTGLTIRFSNLQDGLPANAIDGGGNIDLDPLFVHMSDPGPDGEWDGANDDFGDLRLQPGSPCINAGDPNFVPQPGETDLDGHARVLCGRVDMGAYEFGIGDFDCNQMVNLADVAEWPTCATDPLATMVHQDAPYAGSSARFGAGLSATHSTTGSASLHPWQHTLAPAGAMNPPKSPLSKGGGGPHSGALPRGEGGTACEAFDSDADGDVDLADFAVLQNAFTGIECLSGADCDDADACTSDACENDGTCSHTPIDGCCNLDVDCDDGLSCTTDTCQVNHLCAHTQVPGCIKHTFATFTDPLSGFATQSVRDVNDEIVKFDPVRKSIVYVATGAEYQVGFWPVNGNFLGSAGSFQVRFGTVLGEHRAYFTETGSATICNFVVTPTTFSIFATNTPVPHT